MSNILSVFEVSSVTGCPKTLFTMSLLKKPACQYKGTHGGKRSYFSLKPLPTPDPFPCTEIEASLNTHDDAAYVNEQVAMQSARSFGASLIVELYILFWSMELFVKSELLFLQTRLPGSVGRYGITYSRR